MGHEQIEELLREQIGLSPESIGSQSIAAAVRTRMAARGITDPAELHERLRSDGAEFAEMVEEIVVPESWFFRGLEAFRHLHRHAAQWKSAKRGGTFRALSVPCAAGEEPYSIAMTLLSSGLEPHEFQIDGVDISRRALDRARQAVYAEFSFRETDPECGALRDRYFEKQGDLFRLCDAVKSRVAFERENLVDSTFRLGQPAYDVIFCRNLFIYLDTPARRSAIAALDRLLTRDGVLYMGHAEPIASMDPRFRMLGHAHAFAFCRSEIQAPSTALSKRPRTVAKKTAAAAPRAESPLRPAGPLKPATRKPATAAAAAPPQATPADPLETAARAADSGRLAEAAEACERFLGQSPPTAAAYCLLGVIRQAGGDLAEAQRCFNKALYLDPRHHESLVHMLLIAEQRGDVQQAANFRRRVDQATQTGGGR